MEEKIIKVDDNNVALIKESRTIFGKSQLLQRKENLEAQLKRIKELMDALEK